MTRANPDGSGTQTLFAVSGAPPVFFVDQIYGRRLTIDTNFNTTDIKIINDYATYKAYLKLDDVALLTFTGGHPRRSRRIIVRM